MALALQLLRRQELIQKQDKEGRRRGGGEKGGRRALLRAPENSDTLTPGRFQLESTSSSASSLPFPHTPRENGKFSQDLQHLPAVLGRLCEPGRLAGEGEGGSTHLAHKGSAHLRREEALAGPGAAPRATMGNSSGTRAPNLSTPGGILPTSRRPRDSEVALARCRGAASWGGGLMVAAGGWRSPLPGEGGSPGARRGFTHRARRSSPGPRPARRRLATRRPARPESLYVNEAQLAVCRLTARGRGAGRAGGLRGSTLHSNKAEG